MAVNQPNQTDPLREALRLASHGVKVIQIHAPTRRGCSCGRKKCGKSNGKHPLLESWAEHATADPDTIQKMWEKNSWANVGVPMGKVNGLFAIDVDGPEGQETLQKWIQEHGELPATWQVLTGGGGMQLWYRVPKGIEIPNSVKKIGINVDIRGTGGQSVAPGSLHQSGNRYRWAPTRSPEDLKPSAPPEWLVEKIREVIADQQQAKLAKIQTEEIHLSLSPKGKPKFEKLVQLRKSSKKFREILEGEKTFRSPSERDMAMANIAAVNGWTDQEIADLLIMYRNSQGDDLKHPLYYQLTVGNARQWANEQKVVSLKSQQAEEITVQEVEPIPLPEKPKVEPFPIEVFPEPVRRLIETASKSIGVPPDFVGINALAFMGSAIGQTRILELKPDYRQQANLYVAAIAEPSVGKSPAQDTAFKPILQLQSQHARNYELLMEEYETQYRRYQADLTEWKKKKKGEEPREPKKPDMIDVYTTQTTIEALFRMLKSNPRGIVIKLDEMAGWINSMGQYKSGGKGDEREQYLSMWNGGDLKIDRVRNREKGEMLFMAKTFVSISGSIQPDKLPTLSGGIEDGFIDRFLLSYPDNQMANEKWDWTGIPSEIIDGYAKVFEQLYSLKPNAMHDQWEPKVLYLSEGAKKWWEEWVAINAREINDPDFPRRLRPVWRKMDNQLARVALIIQMVRLVCGETEEGEFVDEVSLNYGIQLIKYFKSHARKVYQQLGSSPEDKRIEEAVEWIGKRGGKVKKRDIQMNKIAGCGRGSDVEQLFRELEDFGYGRVIEIKPKRGPKTIGFELFG
ncbi:DUF3987 domain-containing protein [Paludifilum halophilum]|uniref:DNA primase/polymerase bifunctional N-terminal domain-containing protein n=1 Tax=Paludifilum halophilum TaxID=1642702 RepID=A0A235B1F7_9BACL|nr:DUF3987 domain-containing protein [Paludifilum halophilum]OYD06113.1 hypothetical protein CHM34_18005 [Paludifilum halophilum]